MSQDNTPIIIGVGQVTDRLDTPAYQGLSNVELAAEAGRRALADAAGRSGGAVDDSFATHVDAIGTMRTFEDSVPRYATPFGKSNNFPNSVAKRLAEGELQLALIVGAEAISTTKHLVAQQQTVDWNESLDAPVDAQVMSGQSDAVIGGGVESMSRVPIGSDGAAWASDPAVAYRTYFVPQGVGADLIATLEGFTREQVDAFAVESQRRAAAAWDSGRFVRSIVPVRDVIGEVVLDRDEHIRAATTVQDLAALKPAFAIAGEQAGFDAVAIQRYPQVEQIRHVHHAGNSSGIVDGSAAVLIGSKRFRSKFGKAPRARMDVSFDKVNVNGGSIAMGRPLGATGAMLLGTALDELERRDLNTALITLCVGAGMGTATIIERV
jgi:acetyl-CoA acetyltransferase